MRIGSPHNPNLQQEDSIMLADDYIIKALYDDARRHEKKVEQALIGIDDIISRYDKGDFDPDIEVQMLKLLKNKLLQ